LKILKRLLAKIVPTSDSLAARLIAAATIWTFLAFVGGGILLSNVFSGSAQDSFDGRLRFDLDGLIAAADTDSAGQVSLAGHFADPRFERVYSGWYWQIIPDNRAMPGAPQIQTSRSLWDKTLAVTDVRRTQSFDWGYAGGPEDQHLRVASRHIEFPILVAGKQTGARGYTFLVAGDLSEVESDVADFNNTLVWSFALLAVGLIFAILIQVRVGLTPLRRVGEALARIRDGKASRLEGRFPSEIKPLANELNSLIDHNAEVVARARTHVSNLAHFLKTPLTVLTSEAAEHPGPLADSVTRQVHVMRRQVDHYLTRARASGAVDVLGSRALVRPVLDDLARVLKRIHLERGIEIDIVCPPALAFRGDRQDLEEMTGNLIDNACKWAKQRVSVTASRNGKMLELDVGDDGPGLSVEERTQVGERGERLDESVPGTGFGLAIVGDIARLYGGGLELGESALGGLKASLSLPAT
jgi:signal transduction histidine kinase